MNIDRLILSAKAKVASRVPRYIDLNEVVNRAREEVANMVVERIQTAMEQAVLGAQSILRSTAQEYIEGLYVSDDLTIEIKESARHLEDGYDGFEMLNGLLDSPKAKTSKSGDKYIVVPIGQKKDANVVEAVQKQAKDLFDKGQGSGASQRTLDQMVKDMQSLVRRSSNAPSVSRTANEKAYRTATSKQDADSKWVHPGFQGVNQLEFINNQLRTDLLEEAVRILEFQVDRMRK